MNSTKLENLAQLDRDSETLDAEKKRILLVDDHPVTRRGMTALVSRTSDLMVAGEADGMPRALELLHRFRPDLVIADISLKTSNGLELVKHIKALHPDLPVLIISMYDEGLYAERALRAGAMGYVMKHEAGEKMLTAIRHVLTGEVYLSEQLRDKMLQRFVSNGSNEKPPLPIEDLSDREMEVFQLIGNGYSTKQIAARLGLSVKTIDSYREHLKLKLEVASGPELIRKAIQWVKSESTL